MVLFQVIQKHLEGPLITQKVFLIIFKRLLLQQEMQMSNRVTLNQERTVTSTRSSDRQVGWYDPVSQSILIDEKGGGSFITSVEVYFQSKSETVPVQCQIRTMKNGYPTTTILPFGKVVVEPENVNISDDAS